MRLTLRIRPVHLALFVLLLLSALPPALGAGTAQATSTDPRATATTAAAATASPSATASPLTPTATTTATAGLTPTLAALTSPTASPPALPTGGPSATASATPTMGTPPGSPSATAAATSATPLGATASATPTGSLSPTATAASATTTPVTASTPVTATGATPLRPAGWTRTASGMQVVATSASVSTACPLGWSCADIGNVTPAGGQSLDDATWTVAGGGLDIWNTADQFHFVWQTVTGNGIVSAHVISQTNTGISAKAGVMFRASSTADAPFYDVVADTYVGAGVQVQYRPSANTPAVDKVNLGPGAPIYLRATRVGDTFTAYTSSDGEAWVPIAGSTVTFAAGAIPQAALGGLAVSSYNTSQASTATFDGVSVGPLAWDARRTAPAEAVAHPATAVGANGDVYLFGGTPTNAGQTTDTYIYDPVTDGWTRGAPLPTAVEGAAAVTLPGGQILVMGGEAGCNGGTPCSGGTVYNTAYLYDPATDTFSRTASMGSPRFRFAAVLWQGQVYALGGSDGQQALSSVEAYNPTSHRWGAAASLPQAEEGGAAVVDGTGAIDVLGGFNGATVYNQLVVGTLSGGTLHWASSAHPMPLADQDMGATLGADGRVYLIGGYASNQWLSTVQVYNPVAQTWAYGPALPAALAGVGVVTLSGGPIAALLGGGSTGPASVAAFYGPSLALTPDGGTPGGRTTAQGVGFTPGGTVTVSWGNLGGAATLTATADALGVLTATLTAPLTVTQGDNAVTAQDVTASYPATTSYAGSGLAWNGTLTALPQGRTRPAASLGPDGAIYVFGGSDGGATAYATTFAYHPASASWGTQTPMPVARDGAQAQPLPDGRIAVMGGGTVCFFSTSCAISSTVDVYDPRSDTWNRTSSPATLPALHTPRYRFASVVLQGRIYAIGG